MVRRALPLLTLTLVWLVYLQVLDAPFIWDDRRLILSGEAWVDRPDWTSHFLHPFWSEAKFVSNPYYRPLSTLLLELDHRLHGDVPVGFHITNVLLHSLNAILLQFLLLRRKVSAETSFALATGWALLPRLTEAVAWASGRTDVLACTFVLLALHVFRANDAVRGVASSLLLLLGLLAKEAAMAGLVAILASSWATPPTAGRERTGRVVSLGAFSLTFGLYLWMRHIALGERATSGWLSIAERWWQPVEALGRYSADLLVPWTPRLQQGELEAPAWIYVAFGAGAWLVGGVLAVRVWFRRRREENVDTRQLLILGWGVALSSILLVLHLVPIPTRVVAADRFLYLPTVGVAIALAAFIEQLPQRHARGALAISSALVVSLVPATWLRLAEWADEVALWTSTYEDTPQRNGLPANELANIFARLGLYPESLTLRRRALLEVPSEGVIWEMLQQNAATDASQLGLYAEAAERLGLLCKKGAPSHCAALGYVEVRRFQFREAREISMSLPTVERGQALRSDLEAFITEVEQLVGAPELTSSVQSVRLAMAFRIAARIKRRPEALALGRRLMEAGTDDPELRTQVVDYWITQGSARELPSFLALARARGWGSREQLATGGYRVNDAHPLLDVALRLRLPAELHHPPAVAR